MTETEVLADVIALAVHTATAPLLAKIATLEARPYMTPDVLERIAAMDARLSVLGDLRDRVVTVETKVALPVVVPVIPDVAGVLGPIKERMATLDERVSALRSEVDSDDARHEIHEAALQRDGDAIKERIGAVEIKIAAPMAPLVDLEHEAAVVDLRSRVAGLEARSAVPGPAGPPGIDGKGIDGRNGKDADPALIDGAIASQLTKAMAMLPLPKDGKEGVAGLNGKDGRSVTVEDVAPFIAKEIDNRMMALPIPAVKDGRDGIGVAGAVVNRAGHLVLTLSDGSTKDVGLVIGADGIHGKNADSNELHRQIAEAVAAIPKPKDGLNGKDGADGLGFDDLDVRFDDDRGWLLRFARGDQAKEWPLPVPWDAGVWRLGRTYPKGAGVTREGAWWIAQTDTATRPGDAGAASKEWRLAAKRGQDGKPGPPGRDGSDV